jgi:nucleoside-diphosphate-sugar epimerase
MKNILITGGLGFIGTHCIEKWKNEGWKVWIIDNLSSNAITPKHDIAKDCTIIIENILDVGWESLPKFDLILHLASPVGPVGVLKHSGKMARIILDDIYWVIEGAKINNCPLIFVSTSEIYGHRDYKSYLEEQDDKVLHGEFTVRNEYAIAKLLSEIVISNHEKNDKSFKYQIIRPFNVTGRYQLPDGGFVLPRFVKQALSNENITVYYFSRRIEPVLDFLQIAFLYFRFKIMQMHFSNDFSAHIVKMNCNIYSPRAHEGWIQFIIMIATYSKNPTGRFFQPVPYIQNIVECNIFFDRFHFNRRFR